jgi:DNA polymerase beta
MKGQNDNIVKWFDLLIRQIQFDIDTTKGKEKMINMFRLNSVTKALDVIKKLDFKIEKGEDLKNYENIGKGTVTRINEIINTGKLVEVREEDITTKHLEYVDELQKVFGIGREMALNLYKNYNIKNLDDLKEAVKNKKVELPEVILKGLKYVDKIDVEIPRSEMDDIYSFLIKACIEIDPNMDVRICGSYRREKEIMGDIDVIISHPAIITKEQSEKMDLLVRFITYLENKKFIVESLTSKDVKTKYMGICQFKNNPMRRIDIRFMPQESYYTAIMYFTGSKNFNKKMRKIAIDMGYKLNEYKLIDNRTKKRFNIKSEKDIFDILHMEYLQPKDRI